MARSGFADLVTKRPGGRAAAPAHKSVRQAKRNAKKRGARSRGKR